MTTTPSTSLVLPNIITKLMLMAQEVETLSDGTKTFTFKGLVSSMDAHLVYLAQATNDGQERHTKNHVVFSAKGEQFDWSVKQNYVPKGNKFYVTFVMNDYTNVTMHLDDLMSDFKQANNWLVHVLTNAQFNGTYSTWVEDAKYIVYEAANALANHQV